MIKNIEYRIEVLQKTNQELINLEKQIKSLTKKEYKKKIKEIEKQCKKQIKQIDKQYPIEKEIEKF